MKVYVAEREYYYGGYTIIGIFSTKEKAQEACDNDKYEDGRRCGDSHGIEEFDIDVFNI